MAELEKNDQSEGREQLTVKLMSWMIEQKFDIGTADTFEELLHELEWQIRDLRYQVER
jgi:hypothetical protein